MRVLITSRFVLGVILACLLATPICGQEPAAKSPAARTAGILELGGQKIAFPHAIAYQAPWFDKQCTVVLFTDKPVDTKKLAAAVKKGFDGHEFFLLEFRNHITLRFFEEGSPVSVNLGARNFSSSISSDKAVKSETTITAEGVQGQVQMPKPEDFAGQKYRFEATFDLQWLKLE